MDPKGTRGRGRESTCGDCLPTQGEGRSGLDGVGRDGAVVVSAGPPGQGNSGVTDLTHMDAIGWAGRTWMGVERGTEKCVKEREKEGGLGMRGINRESKTVEYARVKEDV